MVDLGRVLVIDGSRVMRETLRVVLTRHSKGVQVAALASEARGVLEREGDLDLVLAEVELPDGSAFPLLEQDGRARLGQRRWLLLAHHPSRADEERAAGLGAAGYLAKPIAFPDIAACLAGDPRGHRKCPRTRVEPRVWLVDDDRDREQLLTWHVQDVSPDGAFLLTPGPVEVGTRLRLDLGMTEEPLRLEATVVRVQEPSWDSPGGLGVRFEGVDRDTRRLLGRLGRRPRTEEP